VTHTVAGIRLSNPRPERAQEATMSNVTTGGCCAEHGPYYDTTSCPYCRITELEAECERLQAEHNKWQMKYIKQVARSEAIRKFLEVNLDDAQNSF
jgi:hypothetical protein